MKNPEAAPAFDFRGSMFTLPALRLRTHDLAVLHAALAVKCKEAPAFFVGAPVVIELGALAIDQADELDFSGLGKLLRDCGMVPVGVREAAEPQQQRAREAGFAVMQGGGKPAPRAAVAPATQATGRKPAKVVNGAVRSGQHVHADGGDLIVMGTVNQGAEVVADGHIHIYGSLRGRARAGARGDVEAVIFALSLEPEVVAIGDEYLVVENPDAALKGRPGRVCLRDGRLMLEPL